MTPQALQQRMLTPHAVADLRDVFPLALREQLPPLDAQLPAAALPSIIASLQAGDLVLRDVGDCSVDVLHQSAAKEAWFLSRLRSKVAVSAAAEATAPAVALVDHGQPTVTPPGVGDFAVSCGAARLPCRLLASPLPEEGRAQRQRQAHETARKKGRPPTHASLHWLQYGWYITHVGATVWVAEVVATVSRIRWQIALLFKQGKSLFHLPVLKGKRPERLRCLLSGRLIPLTMLMRVCSSAAWYASAVCRRAISFPTRRLWLKRHGRFARAVQDGTLETLYADLRQALEPLLC